MTAAAVGAAQVRPNVLRDCARPNTLGGVPLVVPPAARAWAGLLSKLALAGTALVAVLARLGH